MQSRRITGRMNVVAKDYIVDEVRRIREEFVARHNFDVKAILAAARKRQRRSRHKVVAFVVKKKPTSQWQTAGGE